jgi:hypothetical protein
MSRTKTTHINNKVVLGISSKGVCINNSEVFCGLEADEAIASAKAILEFYEPKSLSNFGLGK